MTTQRVYEVRINRRCYAKFDNVNHAQLFAVALQNEAPDIRTVDRNDPHGRNLVEIVTTEQRF